MKQTFALALLLLVAPCSPTFSFGLPRSSSIAPAEMAASAKALRESFQRTSLDELKDQLWASEVCLNHPCKQEGCKLTAVSERKRTLVCYANPDVTEEQAKDLLKEYLDDIQSSNDFAVSVSSVAFAGLSALFSAFAVWQTHLARKEAAIAKKEAAIAADRSIRNESRIEQLSEES